MPPLVFMGVQKKGWSERSRKLAEALVMHESTLCPGCGQPVDESYDPLSAGWYELHEDTCLACEVKDKQDKSETQNDPKSRIKRHIVNAKYAGD